MPEGPPSPSFRSGWGRQVAPLYGCVDPLAHHPVPPVEFYRADLSYLGTYAADRQEALERLFISPARRLPRRRFLLGGSQYPNGFPWTPNLFYFRHVPPPDGRDRLLSFGTVV